ncbi:hypothetical protein AVEN_110336-1, partial [Araneus ventricosus]
MNESKENKTTTINIQPFFYSFDEHKEFSGGNYGNDYYNHHPVGLAPAYGPGGYSYGAGGFGSGIYGGGGYAAEE